MVFESESVRQTPGRSVGSSRPSDSQNHARSLGTKPYKIGLKEDILSALTSIQPDGSFASFGALLQPPPVGLFVRGIGDIPMPLSESKARQLIEKARQAPYGKGSDTIVDTAVRNTWELDAEQFTFRHPGWPSFLRDICSCVASNLGINTVIKAEIYKMLLYEQGAMFKPHTDTEKIPGMIGTLVISLPSAHQGGELVLKHCGEKQVFKTSAVAQSWACWYSDVEHEVLPVTSGYRWVLTYNLAIDPAQPRPSAALRRSEPTSLNQTLKHWLAEGQSRKQKYFYHVLDHDYTEANASLKALKGRDLARVQALKEACNELPVDIFFGLLEKEEVGSCAFNPYSRSRSRDCSEEEDDEEDEDDYDEDDYDEDDYDDLEFHDLDEVFETSYKVKTLVDLEGRMVTKNLHFDVDHLLEPDCFVDLEGEEEYEGYMGNSGPSATHWYRVTAVAVVPRDSIACFFECNKTFCSFPHGDHSEMNYLAQACLQPQVHESSLTSLENLCRQLWGNGAVPDKAWQTIFTVAVQHARYAFLDEAANHHGGCLPLAYFSWVRQWLSDGDGDAKERFNAIQKGISSAISGYYYFTRQFMAVANLVPISKSPSAPVGVSTPDYLLDFARRTLRSCLDTCRSGPLGGGDGVALVDVALYFDDPRIFLSQTVVPILNRGRPPAAALLAFLDRLHRQSTSGVLPVESSMHLYRTIARSFIASADLTGVYDETEIQALELQATIGYEQLTNFLSTVISIGTESDGLVDLLISRLVADAPRLQDLELENMWLPFLRHLIPILVSKNIPLDTACYQQLFSTLLKAYLDTYVQREPTSDRTLARTGVRCSCVDCARLNDFLTNPALTVQSFAVNQHRRQHLAQSLGASNVDCTHTTLQSGSPYSLVVTKTFRHHKEKHQDWAWRRNTAAEQFQQFDQEHLRKLLGSDYSSIVNMEQTKALRVATTRQPRQPRENTGQSLNSSTRPMNGKKRKLPPTESEVVDLTSE